MFSSFPRFSRFSRSVSGLPGAGWLRPVPGSGDLENLENLESLENTRFWQWEEPKPCVFQVFQVFQVWNWLAWRRLAGPSPAIRGPGTLTPRMCLALPATIAPTAMGGVIMLKINGVQSKCCILLAFSVILGGCYHIYIYTNVYVNIYMYVHVYIIYIIYVSRAT